MLMSGLQNLANFPPEELSIFLILGSSLVYSHYEKTFGE